MSTRQKKITFLALCVMLLALCTSAEAQQAGKIPWIGYLSGGSSHTGTNPNAFWQGLREFGYVEGKNIRFEYGLAERKLDQKWPPSYLLVYADARIVTGVRGRRRSAKADRRSDGRAADSWIAPARHRETSRREKRVMLWLTPYMTFESPPRHVYKPDDVKGLTHDLGNSLPW